MRLSAHFATPEESQHSCCGRIPYRPVQPFCQEDSAWGYVVILRPCSVVDILQRQHDCEALVIPEKGARWKTLSCDNGRNWSFRSRNTCFVSTMGHLISVVIMW